MSIQFKIEKLIESKSINKTRFAELIGVSRDTVYNLSDESIKVATLIKVSEVLGVPIMHFFEKQDEKGRFPNQLYKNLHVLENIEAEMSYKEKYFEALEKLAVANEKLVTCNERVLAYTDIKKGVIKKNK
jgi:DNA-binding XRE family transcriptional regulator